jgi:catechol 2,3-dioxygenase-like lactoylglutathione lyase family enzyme
MAIHTIFAHVSCSDLEASLPWYEKLFGMPVTRRPMDGLAEWHFTESAGVQLFEDKKHAGASTLTIGVSPMEPEHQRLLDQGLKPGPVEETKDFHLARLKDPDGNLVVFVSARRS